MKKAALALLTPLFVFSTVLATGGLSLIWPSTTSAQDLQANNDNTGPATPPKKYQSFRSEQDKYYQSLSPSQLAIIKQANAAYASNASADNARTADYFSNNADATRANTDHTDSASPGGAQISGNSANPPREVFGYVPYWEGNIWDSFRWSSLTTVAWFKIVVDYKGDMISSPDYDPPADLISKAHAHGVKVALTVTSVDTSSVNTLIYSPTDYTKAADNIVAQVISSGADGVNVDFEGLAAARRTDFTNFVTVLTNKMHAAKSGSQVSVAMPAIDWNNAYDTTSLASASERLVIMGYDYFGSWSTTAGPVAPLFDTSWRTNYSIDSTIATYLSKAPANKIILAVPWYGHKWRTSTTAVPGSALGSNGYLTYTSAASEAESYGKSWYAPSQATYTAISGSPDQQSWFDDYPSLLAKYYFANDKGLAGVGVWALGYDGGRAEMWDALGSYINPPSSTLKRLPPSGTGNRFDTANAISQNAYPTAGSAGSVTLANAYNWPDALAGAALARKNNGPLLISDTGHLTQATANELKRVLAPGKTVFVLGGTKALASQVDQDVKNLGYKVTRLAGKNREETAALIAGALGLSPTRIMIGTKNNFADALSLSPHSASNMQPVLLTNPNQLSAEVISYLDGAHGKQVKEVIIAGGTAAVYDKVANQLSARGLKITRLAGLNRYDTSAKIAEHFINSPLEVSLATGTNAVDGLAGGPHAAVHGAPILLTTANTLPGPISAYLKNNAGPLEQGFVYGGYTVISPNVQVAAEQIIKP